MEREEWKVDDTGEMPLGEIVSRLTGQIDYPIIRDGEEDAIHDTQEFEKIITKKVRTEMEKKLIPKEENNG